MPCFSTRYQSMIGIHLEQFYAAFSRESLIFSFCFPFLPLSDFPFSHFIFFIFLFLILEKTSFMFFDSVRFLPHLFLIFNKILSVSINSVLRFCFHYDLVLSIFLIPISRVQILFRFIVFFSSFNCVSLDRIHISSSSFKISKE